MVKILGKEKIFQIEIPIAGKTHVFKTDLICNSCEKKIENGHYLYFCRKCNDDLCSDPDCLKKHAGHTYMRFGKVETDQPLDELIKFISEKNMRIK